MIDQVKKILFTGVGLAFATKDKIEVLSKEIAEIAKLSEKEGKEFVNDVINKSERAKEDLKKQIEMIVQESLKKMNLATREELSNLEKELKKMKETLKQKSRKKTT